MNRTSLLIGLICATGSLAACTVETEVRQDPLPTTPDVETPPSPAERENGKKNKEAAGPIDPVIVAPGAWQPPPPASAPPKSRVFVTRDRFTGDLKTAGAGTDGADGADKLCQKAADTAQLNGRFKAWISTSTVNAVDRLEDRAPWYLIDRTTEVFATKESLKKPPQVRIATNEAGTSRTFGMNYVWTGTKNDGARDTTTCGDWTATDKTGTVGKYITTDMWTRNPHEKDSCAEEHALYCFEQ